MRAGPGVFVSSTRRREPRSVDPARERLGLTGASMMTQTGDQYADLSGHDDVRPVAAGATFFGDC